MFSDTAATSETTSTIELADAADTSDIPGSAISLQTPGDQDNFIEYKVVKSIRGKDVIAIAGHQYFQRGRYTWWCPRYRDLNCKAKIKFDKTDTICCFDDNHCHPVETRVYKSATKKFKRKPSSVAKAMNNAPWTNTSKAKTKLKIQDVFHSK